MDHSKMKHDAMPQGDNQPMEHADHSHYAVMTADFKKRFFVVLVLSIPIILLSVQPSGNTYVVWMQTGNNGTKIWGKSIAQQGFYPAT